VLAWIAVCVPAAAKARRETPLTSAEHFKKRLELIAPPTRADRRRKVKRRRQKDVGPLKMRPGRILVFVLAVGAAVASAVAALFASGGMWELHLACDAALALLVAWLLETKRARVDRARQVRSLAAFRARHESVQDQEESEHLSDRRA
jgi:hypothetical protein